MNANKLTDWLRTAAPAEKRAEQYTASKAFIVIPAVALGAYGTAPGYAFYSNPDTGPTVSEHTEAIILGGGIGAFIGAALGWLVKAIIQV